MIKKIEEMAKELGKQKGEIERLNLELQKRDKCSFIGAMRDCPTHGDSVDIKKFRAVLEAINGALEMGIPAAEVMDENSPIRDAMRDALVTPNVESGADAALSRQSLWIVGLCITGPAGPVRNILIYNKVRNTMKTATVIKSVSCKILGSALGPVVYNVELTRLAVGQSGGAKRNES